MVGYFTPTKQGLFQLRWSLAAWWPVAQVETGAIPAIPGPRYQGTRRLDAMLYQLMTNEIMQRLKHRGEKYLQAATRTPYMQLGSANSPGNF